MNEFDYHEYCILKNLAGLLKDGYDLRVICPSGKEGILRLREKKIPLFKPKENPKDNNK